METIELLKAIVLVVTTVSVLVGLGWSLVKVGIMSGKISEKGNTLTRIAEKLDRNMDKIREDIASIKGRLSVIDASLVGKGGANYTESHSPISLTKKGKALVTEIKVEQSMSQVWEELRTKIENECKEKNPYDIQEFLLNLSITDLEKMLDVEGVRRIKQKAYGEGVPLPLLSRVVAIVARDKFFSEKGINEKNVDIHDQNVVTS